MTAQRSYWDELRGVVARMWAEAAAGTGSAVARAQEGGRALEDGLRALRVDVWQQVVDDFTTTWPSEAIPPVVNQIYGHGAFMGAAPAMLEDPRWRRILAFLMPDVKVQSAAAVAAGARTAAIIPMFENNPVMCAFGVAQAVAARRDSGFGRMDLEGMEWDVFLDGTWIDRYAAATTDAETGEAVRRLVDTMLVAHASTTDTVQEALGVDQYADVRTTPKTGMGGVEATHWMDLFGRALALAQAPDLEAAFREMALESRINADEECLRHCFAEPRPWSEAVARYRAVTGRAHFSVVLEVKSRRSTPLLLSDVVAEINRRGVHVAAVGAFSLDEIRGVREVAQRLDEAWLPGPREILFFHYAGDVQRAADLGRLPSGQSVMFNGASLIDAEMPPPGARAFNIRASYRVKREVVDELAEYKLRHDLHIGVYVQEGDCDGAAAGLLATLVGEREDVFDLGFAWGGLRELVVDLGGAFADHRGYGSQRMLEFVGQAHQWETRAARALREADEAARRRRRG